MQRILGHLGFMVAGSGSVVKVAVPSWRTDVHGKADIVEEIVRIVGVDKVPMTPFERGDEPRKPVLTAIQLRTRRAKRALAARGMVEAVTWSFISKAGGRIVRRRTGRARARQPDRVRPVRHAAEPVARPRRRRRRRNANRGYPDVALFEVGQVFRGDKPEDQLVAASGVRHGFASSNGIGRHWSGSAMADALDAKADAFAVLAAAGAPMQALQIVPGGAELAASGTLRHHPDRPAKRARLFRRAASARAGGARRRRPADRVRSDPRPHPRRQAEADPRQAGARTLRRSSRCRAILPSSSTAASRRGDIVRAAQGVDKKLITDVTVFDVYEGKGIDDGKKSIAIAVTIQPREKTLTDQEIDAVAAKIVAEVTKKTGGTLRA